MATKAKGKPQLKKKTPSPGKFKARTGGYEITIKQDGYTMIHRLNAMTDVGLILYQRGMGAASGLSGELSAVATIEVWTQTWLGIVQSVEGYEGIEDGEPITAGAVALIPFQHIDHVVSTVLESIGVYPSDDQKN